MPRKDNIYSLMGSTVHELLEELQQEKITIDTAKATFKERLKDAKIMGHKFMTDNTEKKFVNNIYGYFNKYSPIKDCEYFIEEYFETVIEGVIMRGYIDLYTIDGEWIDVYDYKTSSKFSKKDLETKKLQLIIYAIALQEKYPDKKIRGLYFDMLKYTFNERGTLKERQEYLDSDKKALVKIDYNDETIKQAKEFVRNTHKEIYSDIFYEPKIEPFFCKNICSNYEFCEKAKGGK